MHGHILSWSPAVKVMIGAMVKMSLLCARSFRFCFLAKKYDQVSKGTHNGTYPWAHLHLNSNVWLSHLGVDWGRRKREGV